MNHDEQDAPNYGERQEFIKTNGVKGLLSEQYLSSIFTPGFPFVDEEAEVELNR